MGVVDPRDHRVEAPVRAEQGPAERLHDRAVDGEVGVGALHMQGFADDLHVVDIGVDVVEVDGVERIARHPYVSHQRAPFVVAEPEAEHVRPETAVDGVSDTRPDGVVAGAAVDGVTAHAAIEQIIAHAAVERVVTDSAVERVIAHAAVERVFPVLAVERVVAGAAEHRVIITTCPDDIVARAGVDDVVAAGEVCVPAAGQAPAAAIDDVVAAAHSDGVVAGAAVRGVVGTKTDDLHALHVETPCCVDSQGGLPGDIVHK